MLISLRRMFCSIRSTSRWAFVATALTTLAVTPAAAPAEDRPGYDAAAWLGDLQQFRSAIDQRYPNRDWLTTEREVSLDRWFDQAATAIRDAGNDDGARRTLDALVRRFQDGHLELHWPKPMTRRGNGPVATPATVGAFCAARGYVGGQVTPGTAASMPGYRVIDDQNPFRPGIVAVGGAPVGIVRIGSFAPQSYPTLCEQAATSLKIAPSASCGADCEDHLLTKVFALLTRDLTAAVERLRGAGVQVLLVDLSRNGGGTEWAEAAARIVSPVPLHSAAIKVFRGEAWVGRWRALADRLRQQAKRSPGTDRSLLLGYARQADVLAEGSKPCPASTCSRLAPAGFASGLIAELPAGRLDGRMWAPDVFSAAQFPYQDSVWKESVIVLVDDETWSAAEQFAALLQDNAAAIVMGTRTGGAGCGHLYGDDPVVLPYSKAELSMPNCARFRKDGSNEVGGVVPDVPTGVRWNDGPAYAGRLTSKRLSDAIAQANILRADHAR